MLYVFTVAVFVNEYLIFSKLVQLCCSQHFIMLAYAPMLPHYYYAQNYASIIHQGLTTAKSFQNFALLLWSTVACLHHGSLDRLVASRMRSHQSVVQPN